MEIRSADGASLELSVLGYQFPGMSGKHGERDWDASWLVVAGAVRTAAGASWTFTDPCLSTWEALGLLAWLSDVGAGPGVSALDFTEPELSFSLRTPDGDALVLEVGLSHGAAGAKTQVTTLALETSTAELRRVAAIWREELTAFPVR